MSRASSFALRTTALLCLWWIALSTFTLTDAARFVVSCLPLYALVAFGSYSLFMIGYNLILFRDTPEAAVEVQNDIVRARAFLKGKGFVFDNNQ